MNGMNPRDVSFYPYRPEVGCTLLAVLMLLTCVMPFFLMQAMSQALANLHLSPTVALPVIVLILLGGLVNIPVSRIERGVDQPTAQNFVYTSMGWIPVVRRQPTQTIIAINLGGCIIPALLAIYETAFVATHSPGAVLSLAVAVIANVGVCYLVARPVPGIGIAMPSFASPAVAIGVTWLLLWHPAFAEIRAPVAFVAGVSGPLIGADLLHLRNFARMSAGMISIGGAGTFDGIVVSGMLAALLTSW